MATGSLDANGIWIYGEDDSETTFSALLNKLGDSTSDAIGNIKLPGRVIQTFSTTKTDVFSASQATTTWTAISGLTATITPKSSSNKILVTAQIVISHGADATQGMAVQLTRGGSAVTGAIGNTDGSRLRATTGTLIPVNDYRSVSFAFLDSPASTSELTYGANLRHLSSLTQTVYVNRGGFDANAITVGRFVSTITVMEITA